MSDDGKQTDNSKLFDSNPEEDEEEMDTTDESNSTMPPAGAMQGSNEQSELDMTEYTVIEGHEFGPEDPLKVSSDGTLALSPSNASLNETEKQKKKRNQNNRLKEQNKNFKEEINRLQSEKTESEENIRQFQEEIKRLNVIQAQLQESCTEIAEKNISIQKHAEENINSLKAQNDRLAQENNRLSDQLKQFESKNKCIPIMQNEIDVMKKEIDEMKKKTLSAEEAHTKAMAKTNKEWNSKVFKVNTEKDSAVKKLDRDIQELKNETSKLKNEKAELQKKLKEKEKAIGAKMKENENFVASVKYMKEQYDAREKEFCERIKNLSDGKSQVERLVMEKQRCIEHMQATLQDHVSTINNHVSTIHSLEKDKKDLTLRLSKLAGANLTYNNPNIADLSDENRPTKLAEEFSELYDNEWTDAFEKIDMSDEREKTQFMLNLLKRASDLCHDTSKRHMTAIKQSFSTLSIEELKVENVPAAESGEESTTTKIQGGVATEEKKNEKEWTNDDVNTLPSVNNTEMSQEGDDATSENGEATDETNKNKEPTQTNDNGHQQKSVNGGELSAKKNSDTGVNEGEEANDEKKNDKKESQTTHNCKQSTRVNGTELCMGEKDDTSKTEEDADTDGKINRNNFDIGLPESDEEDLEKSGENKQAQATYIEISVDFEKLANEQKKTILDLRKMVENQLSKEFQEVAKGIIVKQLSADQQNEDSIVAYIEACVAICWSMCRHEPPVHIYFPEPEEDTKYDTNMFKPYTKTGKLLDYIVWPALYLHEGGPMLAKGVAQGRNMNTC